MAKEADNQSGFSKRERECAYWTFLALVCLCYTAVIDKSLFVNGLEDLVMEFARMLISINGSIGLLVVTVVVCRTTSDARRAVVIGFALLALVIAAILLNTYVFPKDLIPVEIDSNDVIFQTPKPTASNATLPTMKPDDAAVVKEVDDAIEAVDRTLAWGLDDLQNLLGFGFAPIVMVAFFGSIMWLFRVDSRGAWIGTIVVFLLGLLVLFKVMVLDKHFSQHHPCHCGHGNATACHCTHATITHANATATWAVSTAMSHMQPAVATGSKLGALARLRGVEVQLDALLRQH